MSAAKDRADELDDATGRPGRKAMIPAATPEPRRNRVMAYMAAAVQLGLMGFDRAEAMAVAQAALDGAWELIADNPDPPAGVTIRIGCDDLIGTERQCDQSFSGTVQGGDYPTVYKSVQALANYAGWFCTDTSDLCPLHGLPAAVTR